MGATDGRKWVLIFDTKKKPKEWQNPIFTLVVVVVGYNNRKKTKKISDKYTKKRALLHISKAVRKKKPVLPVFKIYLSGYPVNRKPVSFCQDNKNQEFQFGSRISFSEEYFRFL